MSDNKRTTVSRDIAAPTDAVFGVLADPSRHTELDGSGFVKGLAEGDRLTHVGQKFTMDMSGDHMGGDYQTDNIVSAFEENRALAWKTAPAGTEPPGWYWSWQLAPNGDATTATLVYDWSEVTDQDLLDKVGFPLVEESDLEQTLTKLDAAATAG